jgi:hypothetical protein
MMDWPNEIDSAQRFRALLAWLRRNLLVFIFAGMLALQFVTWMAILDLRRYFSGEPPKCDFNHPCHVVVDKP